MNNTNNCHIHSQIRGMLLHRGTDIRIKLKLESVLAAHAGRNQHTIKM